MRVLAADTTGARASVALVDEGVLVGAAGFATARPRHAESLLPTIDLLLRRLSLTPADVDGLAVAAGPGSFTGIRVGISAVEGLAYALERPIVGVSALEASAFRHRHQRGLVVAMIEAYRGEIYGAAFRASAGEIALEGGPVCEAPDAFLRSLPAAPSLVVGTATLRHRETIEAVLGAGAPVADASFFLAEEVARLGAARLAKGESAELGGVAAIYLSPSAAERNRASPPARARAVDA